MEDDNVDHDGVKGEEDYDVENNHVEEEEEEEGDDDVEDDDVEEEDRSQDRDPQFVRACAVEMHMDMSHEPFGLNPYRKNPLGWMHCMGEKKGKNAAHEPECLHIC